MSNPLNNNMIIIEKISNGFIVELPEQNSSMFKGMDMEAMMKNTANAFEGDPGLQPAKEEPGIGDPIRINSDKNTFMFPTFGEVLGFLKIKIDE